jgi:hypothetical protein
MTKSGSFTLVGKASVTSVSSSIQSTGPEVRSKPVESFITMAEGQPFRYKYHMIR